LFVINTKPEFSFLQKKVKNAIKTKLRSWKISQLKISRFYSLGNSSGRNHSYPTLYSTQITSNQSTIARTATKPDLASAASPNDPARLPILQEDKV
jgi:hypothetical protein